MPQPAWVFISYSHDSPEHRARVLELADSLRNDGIDARIDRYIHSPAEGWARWIRNEIAAADFIICVCTAEYRRSFEGHHDPQLGLGVNAEGFAIAQDLYDNANVSVRYLPVIYGSRASNADIPGLLRGFTTYTLPGQYEEILDRFAPLLPSARATRGATAAVQPLVAESAGSLADQNEVSGYLRPEAYPLRRLAPTNGIFVSRLINSLNRYDPDGVMTIWLASRGSLQYVLDSVRIVDVAPFGFGPIAAVAMPPDATYEFSFHDNSDSEEALNPALSIGPDTRNMAHFTVSIGPDRPLYSGGNVWVSMFYHTANGRRGSLVLAEPPEVGRVVASLVDQDVLVGTPVVIDTIGSHAYGNEIIEMVVTHDGLQRGLEKGHEPVLQLKLIGELRLPRSGDRAELENLRGICRDRIVGREALCNQLIATDQVATLKDHLGQGKLWAADVLGGIGDEASTAILQEHFRRDSRGIALYGLCVRHLAHPDNLLSEQILANTDNLERSSLEEVAAALTLAPAGNWFSAFDRLERTGVVRWLDILRFLDGGLPSDDWRRLVNHIGGPLGDEVYVRGTMHAWSSPPPQDARLEYHDDDHYAVVLRLGPELISFKIADAWWSRTANWGAGRPGITVQLGEAIELICDELSNDLKLDLRAEPAACEYTFEVAATDPMRPTVTVVKVA